MDPTFNSQRMRELPNARHRTAEKVTQSCKRHKPTHPLPQNAKKHNKQEHRKSENIKIKDSYYDGGIRIATGTDFVALFHSMW